MSITAVLLEVKCKLGGNVHKSVTLSGLSQLLMLSPLRNAVN